MKENERVRDTQIDRGTDTEKKNEDIYLWGKREEQSEILEYNRQEKPGVLEVSQRPALTKKNKKMRIYIIKWY